MEVGTRVVRGPDWMTENQDGGEGNLGTVTRIGDDGDVTRQVAWVYWDCGNCANYRAGLDNKHDLLVLDSTNAGTRHINVTCDGCRQDPILGLRWHCLYCPNFDLCSSCYMTDSHDIEHHFERIDRSQGKGVRVGKRQGATKVPSGGIFPGAKVKRGRDWRYKDQDGGSGKEGEVVEVCGWSSGTRNDAARVHWFHGQRENIYRMGNNGNMFDLQCTVPARGGLYYRDHLPPLHIKMKKTQNGLRTGDRVYVSVTANKLKELAVGHGGWTPAMGECIQCLGVVKDFTAKGGVLVDYRGKCFEFNQQALSKVPDYNRGDEVFVKSDEALLRRLQDGHGGWNETMFSILGRLGKVVEVQESGDLNVEVEDDTWILNPVAVTKVEREERDGDSDSEESGADRLNGILQRLLLGMRLGESHPNPLGNVARASSNDPGQRLVEAASQGHLSVVRDVLDAHPDKINHLATRGNKTALQAACHSGHSSIVKLLLSRGADTDVLDPGGYTALHHAAYGDDKSGEMLQLLLRHGINPNPRNPENNSTPLHLAVRQGNDIIVKLLVQWPGCDVNIQDSNGDTPLFDAIIGKSHRIFDVLMSASQHDMTRINRAMLNCLQFAVLKGNKHAVEKLLAKCPELINVPKDDGFTPLHLAALNDHCEIATLLCGQPSCNVNSRNNRGQSPLHLAVQQGYFTMVEILVKRGADVNIEDGDGDTGLHLSLTIEKFHSTSGLASIGLDLGMELGIGNSRTFANISRYLVNHGANVLHLNGKGESPLDRCSGSTVEDLILQVATGSRPTATSMHNDFPELSVSQRTEAERMHEEGAASAQEENRFLAEDKSSQVAQGHESNSSDTKDNDMGSAPFEGDQANEAEFLNTKDVTSRAQEVAQGHEPNSIESDTKDNDMGSAPFEGHQANEAEFLNIEDPTSSAQEVAQGHESNSSESDTKDNDLGSAPFEGDQTNEAEFLNIEEPISSITGNNTTSDVEQVEVDDTGNNTTSDVEQVEVDDTGNNTTSDVEQVEVDDTGNNTTSDVEQVEVDDTGNNTTSDVEQVEVDDTGNNTTSDVEQVEVDDTGNNTTSDVEQVEVDDTGNNTTSDVEQVEVDEAEQATPHPVEDNSKVKYTTSPNIPHTEGVQETKLQREMDSDQHNTSTQKEDQENGVTFDHEAVKQEQQGDAELDKNEGAVSVEAADVCMICCSNAAEVFFKPCGHNLVCVECCVRMKRCVKCSVPITGKAKRDGTPVIAGNERSIIEKYRSLEMKMRRMEDSVMCCICQEKKKNTVFLCGHGTCSTCAEKLKVCHICKGHVQRKIVVFD